MAETAHDLACREALQKRHDLHVPYLIGEMENALATAQMAWREMVECAANYDMDMALPFPVTWLASTLTRELEVNLGDGAMISQHRSMFLPPNAWAAAPCELCGRGGLPLRRCQPGP